MTPFGKRLHRRQAKPLGSRLEIGGELVSNGKNAHGVQTMANRLWLCTWPQLAVNVASAQGAPPRKRRALRFVRFPAR